MDTTTGLTVRIRNEHSHTLAAGWRLSSTTVEITATVADLEKPRYQDLLRHLQREAFAAGQEEAVKRNATGLEGGCQ